MKTKTFHAQKDFCVQKSKNILDIFLLLSGFCILLQPLNAKFLSHNQNC